MVCAIKQAKIVQILCFPKNQDPKTKIQIPNYRFQDPKGRYKFQIPRSKTQNKTSEECPWDLGFETWAFKN